MSIVHKLKKLANPITFRTEGTDDEAPIEEAEEHLGEPVAFTCKLCGFQDSQGAYCPECLAETMVPAEPEN
ncbi:MAG: hypothetical protein V3T83_07355 [Acidobacteriota bacterium]